MATKNMAYDHAAYLARGVVSLGTTTAGAAAATAKFVAFANMQVYAIQAACIASGSSTYASMWNGTATIATGVGAQTFSLIRYQNVAAAGATPSISTATYGPFMMSLYNGTATGTQTMSSLPGFSNNVPVYGTATTGTAQGSVQATASGGISVNQGDVLWIVQGTDATATGAYALEYSITPLANVTA